MAQKRKRSMDSIFQSRPIKFVIGEEKKKYTVHQEAFTRISMPVQAMLTNGMQESLEAEVVWEDVDTETFGCLLQFAYSGKYDGSFGPNAPATVPAEDSVAVDAHQSRQLAEAKRSAESLADWLSSNRCKRAPYMYEFCVRNFVGHLSAWQRDESTQLWKRIIMKADRQEISDYFMKHVKVFILADKYDFDSLEQASCDIVRQALLFIPLTPEVMEVLIDTFCFVNANTPSEGRIRTLFICYFIAQLDWIKRHDYLVTLLESVPELAHEVLTSLPQGIYDQLKGIPDRFDPVASPGGGRAEFSRQLPTTIAVGPIARQPTAVGQPPNERPGGWHRRSDL